MDKKPQFVAAWFGAAITTFIFSLTLLTFLSTERLVWPQNQNFKLYAALPKINSETIDGISAQDARAIMVRNFFKGYNSILADYNQLFVEVADKYQIDYRWLPSIAMQESLGGQKVIHDSKNPFGYGIYENSVIRFSTWEEAIVRVGRALREDYLNKGLKTPYQIMTKYTPPSLASGGSWAKGVSSFMEELK